MSRKYEQMVCEDNQGGRGGRRQPWGGEYDSTFTIEDNPAAEDLPLVELVDNQFPQTLPTAATVEGSQESGRMKRQRKSGSADHISGYSMGGNVDCAKRYPQLFAAATLHTDAFVGHYVTISIFGKTYN